MTATIRVGIGGWTHEPWRGVFYPVGLSQKRELEFASRAVNTIEINGTFYSTFNPDSWRRWRDETPDGFVFSIKGSRFCTNRKALATAGEALERFVAQGMAELGDKLGPIVWQLSETKSFDPADLEAFFSLLPREVGNLYLRHAIEVSHSSFCTPAFYEMAAAHGVAVVGDDAFTPQVDETTVGFTYTRFKNSSEEFDEGFTRTQLDDIAQQARKWSGRGDVFVYFIAGAKVRNPAAAQVLLRRIA